MFFFKKKQNFTGRIKIDYPTYICKVKIVFRHHVNWKFSVHFTVLRLCEIIFLWWKRTPSLTFQSIHRERMQSNLQTWSIPNTGGHKGVIFQSLPCPPPAEGVRLQFKGRRGNFLGPVPLVPPSLSPASSGAALWGCHTRSLYNMGYCQLWLVTADEAFKEAFPLWFLLKFWGVGARPGFQTITDVVMGGLCSRLAFWPAMGRGCSKSTFEQRMLVGALQCYCLLYLFENAKSPF